MVQTMAQRNLETLKQNTQMTFVLLMHMGDWMPHVQSLVVLMAEDSNQEVLVTCWQALAAVAGSIPKEMMPSYVRTLKEAVSTAREKERRKRRPLPLRVAGFCLPKALQPVLPIFLQGVLQVHPPLICPSPWYQHCASWWMSCFWLACRGLAFGALDAPEQSSASPVCQSDTTLLDWQIIGTCMTGSR